MVVDMYTLEPNPYAVGEVIKVTMDYGQSRAFVGTKNYIREFYFQVQKVANTCKVSNIFAAIQDEFIRNGLAQIQNKGIRWTRLKIENTIEGEGKSYFVKRLTGLYGMREEASNSFESFTFAIYARGLPAPRKLYLKGVASCFRNWDLPVIDPEQEARDNKKLEAEIQAAAVAGGAIPEQEASENQSPAEQKKAQELEKTLAANEKEELKEAIFEYGRAKKASDSLKAGIGKAEKVLALPFGNGFCTLKVVLYSEDSEPQQITACEGLGMQMTKAKSKGKAKKKAKIEEESPKEGQKPKKNSVDKRIK